MSITDSAEGTDQLSSLAQLPAAKYVKILYNGESHFICMFSIIGALSHFGLKSAASQVLHLNPHPNMSFYSCWSPNTE